MTFKRTLLLQLGCTLIALLAAAYVQGVMAIAPCPLCILQRVAYIVVAIMVIIGLLHRPKRWGCDVYLTVIALFILAGLCVALYQVWLQFQPTVAPDACGAGLDPLLAHLPKNHILSTLFASHADCSIMHWTVLGLSMATWSAVLFLVMLVLLLWGWVRQES